MKHYNLIILYILLFSLPFMLFAKRDSIDTLPSEKQMQFTEVALEKARKQQNTIKEAELLIKKGYILFMNAQYNDALEANNIAISFITKNINKEEKAFGNKEELNNLRNLLIEALSNKGLTQVYCEQTNLAMETFRSILNTTDFSNSSDSISTALAKTYNGMGIVFAHRNHYEIALPYFKKSLEIYEKLKEQRGLYLLNSNIGSTYLGQAKYKEAIPFLTKAQEIVIQENYLRDEPVYTNLNLAVAYQGMGKNKIAELFFLDAIKIAQNRNLNHLLISLRSNYAKNLYIQKRYSEAEKVALLCYKQTLNKPLNTIILDIIHTLADIKEVQGDYNAANKYLRTYISKKDSISEKTKWEDLIKQKFEFDHYKQEFKRKDDLKNLELAKSKLISRNLWVIVLCLCIVTLIVALTHLYRKYISQAHNNESIANKLKEQNELDKKRLGSLENHFSAQIDGKNKELASNALLFLRLSSIGGDIVDKTKQLKVNFALRGKEKMLASEIEHLAEQLEQNKGWGEFEFYFEQVDKDFLRKLSEKYPSLTPKEKQLCVLFNLNLSNKEIASLTGKSLQSVGMAKFRLKKKMELKDEEDISVTLQKL